VFHISIWMSLELCLGRLSPLKPPVATGLIEPQKNAERLLVSIFLFGHFWVQTFVGQYDVIGTCQKFSSTNFPVF